MMSAVEDKKEILAPMMESGVHAGFPSPAQDYINSFIDLNKELVRHPAATFFARVVGDSMVDADVNQGDVLVVDNAVFGMSAFAPEFEVAVFFFIKLCSPFHQLLESRRSFLDHHFYNLAVVLTVPGTHGVVDMLLEVVFIEVCYHC